MLIIPLHSMILNVNIFAGIFTERSSPVILSAAKDLCAPRDRSFAALRMTGCDGSGVTGCDGSHCQGLFFTIEPCLTFSIRKELRTWHYNNTSRTGKN